MPRLGGGGGGGDSTESKDAIDALLKAHDALLGDMVARFREGRKAVARAASRAVDAACAEGDYRVACELSQAGAGILAASKYIDECPPLLRGMVAADSIDEAAVYYAYLGSALDMADALSSAAAKSARLAGGSASGGGRPHACRAQKQIRRYARLVRTARRAINKILDDPADGSGPEPSQKALPRRLGRLLAPGAAGPSSVRAAAAAAAAAGGSGSGSGSGRQGPDPPGRRQGAGPGGGGRRRARSPADLPRPW